MKVVFVLAVIASFFADNHALPVGNERQREDVVAKCLVEVLSKALSKPDSHPLDQECKDVLQAGPKHASLEKKSNEEDLTPDEEAKGHEEAPPAEDEDVKDIQALLKSVAEKREATPEDERSQESWGLDDEKEKRHHEEEEEDEEEGEREKRIWKPTHRYHHKKHRKRGEELSEEEPDEERSQESWDLDEGREKRSWGSEEREKRIWKPTHRYHHKKHGKRDEEASEEVRGEPDEERSQESWGLDEVDKRSSNGDEREKRAGKSMRRYPSRRLHRRDEEAPEEVRGEPDEERSQESWGLDEAKRSVNGDKRAWKPKHKYPNTRLRKRDEEASEEVRGEPDEERSQESWGLDEEEKKRSLDGDEREKRAWKLMHKYPNVRLRKRDEEASEEVREGLGDEERSQESWGLDDDKEKRAEEENEEREKRIWKPTHRYHHKKHRKRSGGSSEEEEEEEERRSDSGEYEEEKRFLAEKRGEMARHLLAEGEVYDKRSPWIYRSYYHPAWWKRSPEGHALPPKVEDLTRLLSLVRNEAVRRPDEKRLRQMPLTPEEEKELENLAAMDRELQQIAVKMHDHRSE